MKDEIKEILKGMQDFVNGDTWVKHFVSEERLTPKVHAMNFDTTKKILDYITNLQTIEQQYSAILSENAELENKITNLQEELEEQKRIEKASLDKILDLEDTIVDKKECIYALETSLTNLQEIEKDHQRINGELRKETEDLNKQLNYLRNDEYLKQVIWERNLNEELVKDLQQQLKQTEELAMEYKTRNEKAIEYIGNGNLGIYRRVRNKFISILKGEKEIKDIPNFENIIEGLDKALDFRSSDKE